MRITFTVSLDISRGREETPDEEEAVGPSGSDAVVELANTDSTPRMLGFQPDQPEVFE